MLSAAGTPLDSRLPFALRREFRGSSPVTILERVKGALLLGFAIAALTAACSGMIALVVVVLSAQIG